MEGLLRAQVRTRMAVASVVARAARRSERGDVPGWVLITVMTAGLVTALWAVSQGALSRVFRDALDSVHAP